MRERSSLVKTLISGDYYNAFLLVELHLKGTIFCFTTLPYDVELGGKNYSADHGLLTLETPKLSNSLTKDSYTVKLADPEFRFRQYCDNAAASSYLSIDAGFINISPVPVMSTSGLTIGVNQPILDVMDLVNSYVGTLDSLQYIMSENDGIILEIKATSPMGALDAVSVFYLNSNSLQARAGGTYDTAFDNVALSGRQKELLWGKAFS